MSFYRYLSEYYDILFPLVPETADFIARRLTPGSTVLDLACGTGTIALAPAERGHEVVGVDLDAAMIDRARRKAGTLPARFRVGDMMAQTGPAAGFGAVLCLGNSLVHLDSENQIAALLAACRRLARLAAEAGFIGITCRGGYGDLRFTPDAPALVLEARCPPCGAGPRIRDVSASS